MSVFTTRTMKNIQLTTTRSDISVPDEMNLHKIGPCSPNRAVSTCVSNRGATSTPNKDGGEPRNRTVSRLSTRRRFRDDYRPFSAALQKWRLLSPNMEASQRIELCPATK